MWMSHLGLWPPKRSHLLVLLVNAPHDGGRGGGGGPHGRELDVDDVGVAREVVLHLAAAARVEGQPVHQVDGAVGCVVPVFVCACFEEEGSV